MKSTTEELKLIEALAQYRLEMKIIEDEKELLRRREEQVFERFISRIEGDKECSGHSKKERSAN